MKIKNYDILIFKVSVTIEYNLFKLYNLLLILILILLVV